MKEFKYVIRDPMGMHARPVAMFVNESGALASDVRVTNKNKTVDGKKVFAIMGLAVDCGEEVTITLEGSDEEAGAKRLQAFMEENL